MRLVSLAVVVAAIATTVVQAAVMVVGASAEAGAWWVVAAGRRSVWRVMPAALAAMGVAAALVRPPLAAGRVGPDRALAAGLASGLILYVATRAFVWVASRWGRFRRDVAQRYGDAAQISLRASLALSLLVLVPAEELFWRGLFQARLAESLAAATAAGIAWACYVLANVPSRSLPIVAAAIVGGALWTGLAWWSGGVLASLGSHILWTGLMLALPPGPGRGVATT